MFKSTQNLLKAASLAIKSIAVVSINKVSPERASNALLEKVSTQFFGCSNRIHIMCCAEVKLRRAHCVFLLHPKVFLCLHMGRGQDIVVLG